MVIDDNLFIGSCSAAIRTLREGGINDVIIACVLTEVRSAALIAERFRVEQVHVNNPPTHHDFGHILKLMNKH